MKKLLVILLTFIMILSFVACGNKIEQGDNELVPFFENGYEISMFSYDDESGNLVGLLKSEKTYAVYELVMTSKEYDKCSDLFMSDEEMLKTYLTNFEVSKLTDVTTMAPNSEELNSFVGKTISDVENMGYEEVGSTDFEGSLSYTYANDVWEIELHIEGVHDTNALSPNDIKELKIASVEFNGFGFDFLDNYDAE